VTISGISIGNLTTAITQVASLRATSGATSSRLQFSSDFLDTSKTNLEAANSRIMDVDVADEVTNYAKYNVQVYAASAALAQANVNMGIVLDLLNFGSSR
ncbi:MAG TPA: flagellin, partial [Opitutae bacterium]|nr:flagellin [Opitutae bacterium]